MERACAAVACEAEGMSRDVSVAGLLFSPLPVHLFGPDLAARVRFKGKVRVLRLGLPQKVKAKVDLPLSAKASR